VSFLGIFVISLALDFSQRTSNHNSKFLYGIVDFFLLGTMMRYIFTGRQCLPGENHENNYR
jgi:hypothetical protein